MRRPAALLCCMSSLLLAQAACADDKPAAVIVAGLVRDGAPGAGNNDAPRFVRSDTAVDSQPAPPGYSAATTELGHRWWVSHGRADLGLGLGMLSTGWRPNGSVPALGSTHATAAVATGSVLTLGMRYRTSANSALYADASGVRAAGLIGGDAVVGKVGVEFKSAQSRFGLSYGGLGMRLSGDTRMTFKLRRGGIGVAMRSSF